MLSDDETRHIPRSTQHYFNNYDFSKVYGQNYLNCNPEAIQAVIFSKSLQRICIAYQYIHKSIYSITSKYKVDFKKYYESGRVKKKVISIIEKTKSVFGFEQMLKVFHISKNTFYRWKDQKKCSDSPLKKCFRKYPNQLTSKEVYSIRNLFDDPKTRYWPLASVYYDAFRKKIISFKLRTFYKYAHILGISRPLPPSRRCKNRTGIRTDAPNKLLHSDLTIFKTMDNIKVYIYIVMDNFSRKILAYRASLSYSANLAFNCLKEAYENHILPNQPDWDVELMVDGGSEVNNATIDSYIKTISVKKIIAQQDVSFSNSMIEAVNKIMKYNYLFREKIPDFESCSKYLEKFIPDYNERPHCSLQGLTPNEAYSGVNLNLQEISEQVRSARAVRILENRQYFCPTHLNKEV